MKSSPTSWSGWALETFVTTPVSWGFNKILQSTGISGGRGNRNDEDDDLAATGAVVPSGWFIVKPIVEVS